MTQFAPAETMFILVASSTNHFHAVADFFHFILKAILSDLYKNFFQTLSQLFVKTLKKYQHFSLFI